MASRWHESSMNWSGRRKSDISPEEAGDPGSAYGFPDPGILYIKISRTSRNQNPSMPGNQDPPAASSAF